MCNRAGRAPPVSFTGFLGGTTPGGTDGPAGDPRPGNTPPVFLELFYTLRRHGLRTTPHEWFTFLRGLEKGLAQESLTGLYHLGRTVFVKSEAGLDLYDLAFADFFRGLPEVPDALREALEDWLAKGDTLASETPLELPPGLESLDLEELLRRFEETLREQDEQHDGGSTWIGTHGTSPYGRGGRFPGGLRIGGTGGGRQAIQIAQQRQFRAYRSDRTLDVRQVRLALRRLRDLAREGQTDELDLEETIDRTSKNAGEIELAWRRPRRNSVRLLVLMDVGGSMTPYAQLVSRMFSAANQETHWRKLAFFYFHNCVYQHVYKDAAFREKVKTSDLIRDHEGDWKLVVIGDACMAMSELMAPGGSVDWYDRNQRPGIEWLRQLGRHFRKTAWLNPMPRRAWDHPSVQSIEVLFPMYELTLDGLGEAVGHLKGQGAS